MCLLLAFSDCEVINGQRFGVGYKIFERFLNLPYNGFGTFQLDEINIAEDLNERIETRWKELNCGVSAIGYAERFRNIGSETYGCGFHIFLNKDDCRKYHQFKSSRALNLCRVLFDEVTTFGINGTDYYTEITTGGIGLCVVASKLYIKTEDWKNVEPLPRISEDSE
jgi:hypothetical protein